MAAAFWCGAVVYDAGGHRLGAVDAGYGAGGPMTAVACACRPSKTQNGIPVGPAELSSSCAGAAPAGRSRTWSDDYRHGGPSIMPAGSITDDEAVVVIGPSVASITSVVAVPTAARAGDDTRMGVRFRVRKLAVTGQRPVPLGESARLTRHRLVEHRGPTTGGVVSRRRRSTARDLLERRARCRIDEQRGHRGRRPDDGRGDLAQREPDATYPGISSSASGWCSLPLSDDIADGGRRPSRRAGSSTGELWLLSPGSTAENSSIPW